MPSHTFNFWRRGPDKDHPIFFVHFLNPWFETFCFAACELDMPINFKIFLWHPDRLEAQYVTPRPVRIVIKNVVKNHHIVTVKNALHLLKPISFLIVFHLGHSAMTLPLHRLLPVTCHRQEEDKT